MNQPGFLGSSASAASDLSLIAYIAFIIPLMLIGFAFARRKLFEPHHKYVMTFITIFNWVVILYLMLTSYREGVLPNLPQNLSDPRVALPTIHLVTGALGQLTATYLVIRMWFERRLPSFLKVIRIKRYMRFTLTMWLVTAFLGILIYVVWYTSVLPVAGPLPDGVSPVVTQDVPAPVVTEAIISDDDDNNDDAADDDADAADEATDRAEDEADDATDSAEELADDLTDTAEDLADDMTDAAEDALDD
jgi:uncharacterized membrane protein YozB (DUF420 family)